LELQRWRAAFAGTEYYYGRDPGPVARRAVRYHNSFRRPGATALDLGCGEGQDLLFLAQTGYSATGVEFTPEGAAKSRALLAQHGVTGTVLETDLVSLELSRTYDLVLAVNCLQFTGRHAPHCLERVAGWVAPGGVLGLSLFAREDREPADVGTLHFFTIREILDRFEGWQRLEAAHLWQWNTATDEPQPFITLIARNRPPSGRGSVVKLG
jgi:SAM-dependent methyltransferase